MKKNNYTSKQHTAMKKIQMVDLQTQYQKLKPSIDAGIQAVLDQSSYINGPAVQNFQQQLADYLGVKYVIPCANGTDALQIAMMALDLQPGDEVIVPSFTYVATAEVIALLRLKPIMVDVDPDSFLITPEIIEKALTPQTKLVVPVHLFGQSADMEAIMQLAEKHGFFVIEDNAQALGADFSYSDGRRQKAGTFGHIGCTSFYPSKNLGAYGDGGAMFTNDDEIAAKLKMIANHGQVRRYYHDVVGCNSRLDSIQAAILLAKLPELDNFAAARNQAAEYYDAALGKLDWLEIPKRVSNSNHVFHQYTLKIKNGQRDALQAYLQEKGIPTMIYYPVPLQNQLAFQHYVDGSLSLPVADQLCNEVISLPMHTELTEDQLHFITEALINFTSN